jgi:hypothetical protein
MLAKEEKIQARNVAYAAVYFFNGIAGSLGFLFYKVVPREQLAILNVLVALVAVVCYCLSHNSFKRNVQRRIAKRNIDRVGDDSNNQTYSAVLQ